MHPYNTHCLARPSLWIILVLVYFLQVGITSGFSPQMPIPNIPDSDETIIIPAARDSGNGTSLKKTDTKLSTNVDQHIADYIPKTTLPKKVQSGSDITEKETVKEKFAATTTMKNKTVPQTAKEKPPKNFPTGADDILTHEAGTLSKNVQKLLSNTNEEHRYLKEAKPTVPTSTENESPPKDLPASSVIHDNITKPLIINHIDTNSSKIAAIFPADNSTGPVYNVNKTSEAFDMTHSKKYYGQYDPDDVKHIADKINKTKVQNSTQLDPKIQVDVSQTLDKNGPKSMSTNKKTGITGVLSSTSNVLALSSAVLSSKTSKTDGILQPIKAVAATVITIVGMTIFGMAGFLLWRRIMQRRFGHREMLINEDDFEEVSDLHHFEGTSPQTPNLVA